MIKLTRFTIRFILFLVYASIFPFVGKCFGSVGQPHKNNIRKCLLCGKSLEIAYSQTISARSGDNKNASMFEIIEYARNACNKKNLVRSVEERVSFNLISLATQNLAKRIIKETAEHKSKESNILVFGGIIQGCGDFLKEMILKYIDRFKPSDRKIKIIFSEMGDERAILGAIKYAELKLNSLNNPNGQYAIGLDVGGTNIRAGIVDLEKNLLLGKLAKRPVFVNKSDRNKLYSFTNQIRSVLSLSKNHKTRDLGYFLKDRLSQVEYELLSDLIINRICDLIKELKKDLNIKFVAIASAGTIDEDGFCWYAYNLPFTCVDIKQRVENVIQVPVIVANDMSCAAIGEQNFGALKFVNEFIIIGLGTGLGVNHFNFK